MQQSVHVQKTNHMIIVSLVNICVILILKLRHDFVAQDYLEKNQVSY